MNYMVLLHCKITKKYLFLERGQKGNKGYCDAPLVS